MGLIKREVDVDYYEFNVYGKANLDIKLSNIPNNCDYDLELLKHNNLRYAEEDDAMSIASSTFASNQDEHISRFILPGVYYVRVYSYNDSFDAHNKYQLLIQVDYVSENVNISDLRYNKGVGAALWVSDYDPFEIPAFSSSSKSEVGFLTSSQYYSAYKFGNPMFNYIRNNKILHASLYIWDLQLRTQLYEIVKESISILQTELASKERIRASLEITSEFVNGTSIVVCVWGLIMTFIPVANVGAAVSFGINVVSTIGPSILDCIFNAIMPESKIEETRNYLTYLQVLKAALECNSSTSDQEVIKIDSSYKITSEAMPGIVHINYDIDFTPEIQDKYLYDKDTIYAFIQEAKFNGTVYPLKTLDDIQKARLKNQNPIGDINTGGDTEIILDHPVANELEVGEYHWYHFIAPETATYEFKTDSSFDTYGELFYKIVPGQSNDGIVAYDDDGDYTNGRNFSLTYNLFKGRTIYLRVSGFGWKSTGYYALSVNKQNDLEPNIENIHGSDFNFQNEYVDNENRTNISLSSGFSFTTSRIRCGYINNQYLALSAKCKDAGTAYLQMDFDQDINSFEFGIAIWSEEEYLNTKSSIVLETKSKDGIYRVYCQFDISKMSKNKDQLDLYNFTFLSETFGIRIRVTTNQVNYEKNKGRVVLGDMKISHLD